MKDERVLSELNQVKRNVLIYVFIANFVLTGIKFLMGYRSFNDYHLELFIILLNVIFLAFILYYKNTYFDERIEHKISKMYQITFFILLIMGLLIHFNQFVTNLISYSIVTYITNFLILIGAIVFIASLKKRNLYANYKYIESKDYKYFVYILRNVLYLLSLYIFIFVFVFLLHQNELTIEPLKYFVLVLSVSFVAIAFEYVLFSVYEINHYKDELLFEKNIPNQLPKNAFTFQVIISFFVILTAYITLRYQIVVFENMGQLNEDIQNWAAFSGTISLVNLEVGFISLLISFVIAHHLKRLTNKHQIIDTFIVYSIFSYLIIVTSITVNRLYIPLMSHDPELIIGFITPYNKFMNILVLLLLTYRVLLVIYLIIKNIGHQLLLVIYLLSNILTLLPIYILNMQDYYKLIGYIQFVGSIMSSVTLLAIIYLFTKTKNSKYQISHTKFDEITDEELSL